MAPVGIAQQDDAALRAAGFEPYETPSPFIHFIGGLWCKVEADRAFAALRIQDPHCNSFGSIHGGMLLALSDQLIAMSSRLLTGRAGMTMHVDADFLDAAPAGTVLQGRLGCSGRRALRRSSKGIGMGKIGRSCA